MNEKLLTGAVVAGSLALAVAAGVVIDGFAERAEKPQREEKPKEDPRPIIEAGVRVKAVPTAAERAASRPGRLRTGEFVVWTITSAHERVRIAPPCVIPNCWTLSDGGWDDSAVVDCRATGLRGLADGGPRWSGCNVLPVEESTGTQCRPTACAVDYTNVPDNEVLR